MSATEWANAEAAAFNIKTTPAMITAWADRLHVAGIETAKKNGWRGPLWINTNIDPSVLAGRRNKRERATHIRSVAAALWLCELIARPHMVGRFERVYGPQDCQPVMVAAQRMLMSSEVYQWVFTYGAELSWLYFHDHKGVDHKSAAIIAAAQPGKLGIPQIAA
jgi:hypothetical protein